MDSRLAWLLVLLALWALSRFVLARWQRRGSQNRLRKPSRSRKSRWRFLWRQRPSTTPRVRSAVSIVTQSPHAFSHRGSQRGTWYDLTRDARPEVLLSRGLPVFQTPDELAAWLDISVGELAWLSVRGSRGRPTGTRQAHYVYQWLAKRSGGVRLIESPKARLKDVQRRILSELLNHVSASAAAHGFVTGRSIVTNAQPHVGSHVLLKFDLRDFYLNISPRQVMRLFRRLGYSREITLWLTRLVTSRVPGNLQPPPGDNYAAWRYREGHLPQGAPTSPALANLVAYGLDCRLAGLAKSFGANYTRYADDLTFSGPESFSKGLSPFIQQVEQIVRDEGFQTHRAKRQILRAHQKQCVAGVVVNEKPNISRADFDRLKAILHLCAIRGPSTQNREQHADFAAHLRGRVSHVAQLNPQRGAQLQQLFAKIDWLR